MAKKRVKRSKEIRQAQREMYDQEERQRILGAEPWETSSDEPVLRLAPVEAPSLSEYIAQREKAREAMRKGDSYQTPSSVTDAVNELTNDLIPKNRRKIRRRGK